MYVHKLPIMTQYVSKSEGDKIRMGWQWCVSMTMCQAMLVGKRYYRSKRYAVKAARRAIDRIFDRGDML